jgi:hypothetical protein
MEQSHPSHSQHVDNDIKEKVVFSVDDGERSLKPSEGGYNSDAVGVFTNDVDFSSVPIARCSDGDTIEVRSVTEQCGAYNGEGPPVFESRRTPVSLVPDTHSVDGVRLAPTDDIDGRKPSYELGNTAELGGVFRSKSQKKGYSETISVVVEK